MLWGTDKPSNVCVSEEFLFLFLLYNVPSGCYVPVYLKMASIEGKQNSCWATFRVLNLFPRAGFNRPMFHRIQSVLEYITTLLSRWLKRQCHVIFCHFLFHGSKPSEPLINSLKWFCLKIRFRKDICKNVTPRSVKRRRVGKFKCPKIKNCLTLLGVGLRAVSHNAESNNFFYFQKLLFP